MYSIHPFNYYQSMRVKNPFLYFSPYMQKEMRESYLSLGKLKFFSEVEYDQE